MTSVRDKFKKLFGSRRRHLEQQYHESVEFIEKLGAAQQAYENDPGEQPISKSDYLAFLNTFETLITQVSEVPQEYDTDFRRNLPGGGINGLAVAPNISARITQARQYLETNAVTVVAGACILQNIDGALRLLPQGPGVSSALQAIYPTMNRVASGTIR